MNKDLLLTRLKEVEQALDKTLATYNSLVGNKNEITYWLQKADEFIEAVTPDPAPPTESAS